MKKTYIGFNLLFMVFWILAMYSLIVVVPDKVWAIYKSRAGLFWNRIEVGLFMALMVSIILIAVNSVVIYNLGMKFKPVLYQTIGLEFFILLVFAIAFSIYVAVIV